MRDLLGYLLAFAAGMVAVATLPRRRGHGHARSATPGPRRLAVGIWVAGCLLTGTLAALAAYMPL